MSAPSSLLERKKLLRPSVAALALRIATTLALVGTVPALRAFARQYTVPDRVIVFLIILGTLFCADTLLRRSRHAHALAFSTLALALNLVKKGIRVNGVAPGPIWTPLNPSGGQPPEKIPEFGKDTPMGRPGQPNEVAPSFLFLACEDSSYMTAQVLHPDGGDTTSS